MVTQNTELPSNTSTLGGDGLNHFRLLNPNTGQLYDISINDFIAIILDMYLSIRYIHVIINIFTGVVSVLLFDTKRSANFILVNFIINLSIIS